MFLDWYSRFLISFIISVCIFLRQHLNFFSRGWEGNRLIVSHQFAAVVRLRCANNIHLWIPPCIFFNLNLLKKLDRFSYYCSASFWSSSWSMQLMALKNCQLKLKVGGVQWDLGAGAVGCSCLIFLNTRQVPLGMNWEGSIAIRILWFKSESADMNHK